MHSLFCWDHPRSTSLIRLYVQNEGNRLWKNEEWMKELRTRFGNPTEKFEIKDIFFFGEKNV